MLLIDLAGDLKGQLDGLPRRLAADERLMFFGDAPDETFQLDLERFLALDRHRLADDSPAAELADDGAVFAGDQFLEQRRFLLVLPGKAIVVALLPAVIERHVAGRVAAAEDANLAQALRADAADGEVGDAAASTMSRS